MRALAAWGVLIVLSAMLFGLLEWADLPAAMLIGTMVAGIVVGVRGGKISVSPLAFGAAQSMVGCLIAASLTPAILPVFMAEWHLFVLSILATVAASSALGWMISRWKVLPGTVGVWGSAPGAATAMVLMAGAFGADQRLVAFMQYLRVIMVSVGAALVARLWVDTGDVALPDPVWFPPLDPHGFGLTLGVAVAGTVIGWIVRLPSPHFLGPLVLGSIAHLAFGLELQIPHWLMMLSFAVVGWAIGLQFRSETLRHAARALPQVVLSILALMVFCGAIAFVLAHEMGIDPLTAYLATSPGGMDTVAIIAAATHSVDVSFVMTMQALRFVFVLVMGPSIARAVARLVKT
ncbi:AbrB family transcriptional regulator [Mesorhizobium microcysteis]|uniref:AbrB family transcriptional regulator n=1 Tax=Neoaquamicrobium microcysteis TaxID=2682781 RepID=A0A5D4GMQ6_9HYPH|nr:AbrB family transcriptional regulator [Mesorhizobium microcysteis]TYR29424.1 AbrB family transcriptional regulator [Mesorhizobium microcysteis]